MGAFRLAIACACLAVHAVPAQSASVCTGASGRAMLPLVELYTSEGCDSCPPADRWLSATFPPSRAGGASVLAFHVDYWDRLGWKDRFASAEFTARQYASMRANRATFVYTPQVLVQGRDVPAPQRTGAVTAAGLRPALAAIALEVAADAGVHARASVADASRRRHAALWLALTESGHVTDVKAGENRGAQLRHDHVVRALHGPFALDHAGEVRVELPVASPRERGSAAALVAFVQDRVTGEVLQSLTLRCGG